MIQRLLSVMKLYAKLRMTMRDDEEIKAIPTNFNEKKLSCKTQSFYILLAFSLITIALLITVSIYCYLINY